jgi:hypothetical protein
VEDVRRVDVLQAAQGLVEEGLEVRVGEGLAGTDLRGYTCERIEGEGGTCGRTIACRSASMSSS